jgi:phospholipid/cholesterol/gamma-HCH transport system substrate-binding protein
MADTNSTRRISDSFVRQHRTFFVGLFILIPLVVIPALLLYTLTKSEVFRSWCRLHAVYNQSYSLGKGSHVLMSGMPIGHVTGVTLVREGSVDIAFKIERRYRPFVRKDSRALIQQKNLVVGDWEIQITGGTKSASEVDDNDTLAVEYSLSIDKLAAQVTGMIGQVDSIIRKIASGKGAVGKLISEDTVINQTSDILRNINGITVQSSNIMKQVDSMFRTVNAVGASSVELVDSLKTVMSGVQKTIADARSVMANAKDASEHFGPMVDQIQGNLDQAEVMMRGLQKNWLIRSMTGKPEDKMLKNAP